MKNKFLFWSLVFVIVLFAVPSVAALQTEPPPPVTVPAGLEALISTLFVFLVTEGLKALLSVFNIDLTGKAALIAAALTTAAVLFLNGILGALPPAWALAVVQFITALLGAGGMFKTVKRFSAR